MMNQKQVGQSRAALKRRKKKQSEILHQQQEQIQTLMQQSNQKRKTSDNDDNDDDDEIDHSIKTKTNVKKPNSSNSATEVYIISNDAIALSELLAKAQIENVDYSTLATDLISFIVSSDNNSLQDFYANYWGRSAYHSHRSGQGGRFDGIFSRKSVRQLLQNHSLYLGKDIDISQHFQDDTKKNINESIEDENDNEDEINLIEAESKDVWDHFDRGHSVCLLAPHVYDDLMWQLLSLLEIEFEAVVGCNIFLLPPNSRGKGFGRRVAQADMIVLQLEGASEWRVGRAESTNDSESAPADDDPYIAMRNNSKNSNELGHSDDMKVMLQQGDTVYVPKGYAYESISQITITHSHSLYLVLLTNETDSYHSMLELVVPTALQSVLDQSILTASTEVVNTAASSSSNNTNTNAALAAGISNAVVVPRSLPRKRFDFLGVANSELDEHTARDAFTTQLKGILRRVAARAEEMADAAVDQVKKQFMIDRLPIPLSTYEERYSSAGFPGAQIFPFTELRAVRPLCGCVVVEDGKVLLFHCMDNTRYYMNKSIFSLNFNYFSY